jgi:ATP-dependent Lon protease
MPSENKKDIRDIPKVVLKQTNLVLVEHMDQVLKHALVLDDPDNFLKEVAEVDLFTGFDDDLPDINDSAEEPAQPSIS